jgi:hypothetical protein
LTKNVGVVVTPRAGGFGQVALDDGAVGVVVGRVLERG